MLFYEIQNFQIRMSIVIEVFKVCKFILERPQAVENGNQAAYPAKLLSEPAFGIQVPIENIDDIVSRTIIIRNALFMTICDQFERAKKSCAPAPLPVPRT